MFCLPLYLRFVAVLSVIANFVLHQCVYVYGENNSEAEVGNFSSFEDGRSGSFESVFVNVSDQYSNAITQHTIDGFDPGIVWTQGPSQWPEPTVDHAKSPVSIDRIRYTRNELLELHGQYDLPQDTLETIRTIPKRTRGLN